MKQKIFSKLQTQTLLDVFEKFQRDSSSYFQNPFSAKSEIAELSNNNLIPKNYYGFLKNCKLGNFIKNGNESTFEKTCLLNFNFMKSILGHINTNSVEENNIVSVPIYCISFSKDDEMIITGDNNGLIKLWSTRTGALIEIFKYHEKAINDLIQIKDYIISVSDDRGIGFWSIKKLKLLASLFLDEAIIRVLTYEYKKKNSGICEVIIFCSANGKIYTINFDDVEELFNENEAANNNDLIDLSQIDFSRLYLDSKIIEKYSLKKLKNNMQQSCMMIGQEGLLVCGYNEGLLCVWDLNRILYNVVEQKRFLCNFEQYLIFLEYIHNQLIQICEFNNKTGTHFLTGSIDGTVLIWKIQHHGLQHFRTLENPSAVYNISTLITQKDVLSGNIAAYNSNIQKNNFVYPIYSIFKISDNEKKTRCCVNAATWTCKNNYVVVVISSKPRKKTGYNVNKNLSNFHNTNINNDNSNMIADNNNFYSYNENLNGNINQQSRRTTNNQANSQSDFQKRTSSILIYSLFENYLVNRLDEENGFFFHDECYVLEPHPKEEEIILTVMNTNEIILVDILKSVILKKFKEENYFFSNIPFNMIAAEGKFSTNGDSFVISTYLGSISIYSVYSKNSYSTTYMNQFFDDEFRNNNEELNHIFPQYVNMYNLPYITQQPFSFYKLKTIKENKRLASNYSMTAREIDRKIFNNMNYSENAFDQRQEDCEKEEKAFILAAKDNITYMINDQVDSSVSDDSADVSDIGSEIYYRRSTNNRSSRNNNNYINNLFLNGGNSSHIARNSNNDYNNININDNDKENFQINHDDEILDNESSSQYDEEDQEDLEDEEISIDSDDYGVVKSLRSSKFLSERARHDSIVDNGNTRGNLISDRAKRWRMRSKIQHSNDNLINENSEIYEECKSNSLNTRNDNKYSKSLRIRNYNPKYNLDEEFRSNNKGQSNIRKRKRLKKRKGKKLGFEQEDNLPKVGTRLGLRSKTLRSNLNFNSVSNFKKIIADEEDDEKNLDNESEDYYNVKRNTTRSSNENYFKNDQNYNNNVVNKRTIIPLDNLPLINSAGNSGYSLRRTKYKNHNQSKVNEFNIENEQLNKSLNDIKFIEDMNGKTDFQKKKIEDSINKINEMNEKKSYIDYDNQFENNTQLNLPSNLKNFANGLSSLSYYEKKKQKFLEKTISSFKDSTYNPFEFINNLGNLDFSNFILQLINNCENKRELCSFCGNRGKNVIGPFYKHEIPSKNSFVYTINKNYFSENKYNTNNNLNPFENSNQITFLEGDYENGEKKENIIYLHIDCLILFNNNLDLNFKKAEIENEEKIYFAYTKNPLFEKILSNTISYTIKQNKSCFRCGSSNATFKCQGGDCSKFFHGNVCFGKYCQMFNKSICCFDCIRNKFINEEKQKLTSNNLNRNSIVCENTVNYSYLKRDFFLRDKFSFYNYFPQKGEKVYFVLQAYEDFLKRYYQYIIMELDKDKIFFWKSFENMNVKNSNKKFNPYYPFLCEINNIEFFFNNSETISYLKKIHRGVYKEKITILIKLNIEIVEINKSFELIFFENSEPDFLINYDNYEINSVLYEDVQRNVLNGNLNNYYLETIISDINYKGRVLDVISKENNKNFFNSPYESIMIAFENCTTNMIEKQLLSFWDICNTKLITKHKNIYDFKEIFSSLYIKIKNFIAKRINISNYFISKVDEIKDNATDYYNFIPVPCYLNLILQRLENLYYINFESIIFDFNLIKENCIKFNGAENKISELSEKLYNYLLTMLEEVLESYKIETDFILLYKTSIYNNKKLNLKEISFSQSTYNKRILRNKNKETENKDLVVRISENKHKNLIDTESLETKSENEYDSGKFNFESNLNKNSVNIVGIENNLIEEEEKLNESIVLNQTDKNGKKQKLRDDKLVKTDYLKSDTKNISYLENESFNLIEIKKSKDIEDKELNKIIETRENYDFKRSSSKISNYYSRREDKDKGDSNNILIPINETNNGVIGRNIRSKKAVKYNENENDLSLDFSNSDKSNLPNLKRRGRPRKNKSSSNEDKCQNFDDFKNTHFSLTNKNIGRKRNRQIIKFELK